MKLRLVANHLYDLTGKGGKAGDRIVEQEEADSR